jgi:NAD(P)-dependent dehydrogenase (short-subunit alcohol dehydrogenase family)
MNKVILITGASSSFGRLTAEALANAGHVVYGSMRQTTSRNAAVVAQMAVFSRENHADLRALELDMQSQDSVDAAIEQVLAGAGRIDVLIHNARHMVFGPAKAFTPEAICRAL